MSGHTRPDIFFLDLFSVLRYNSIRRKRKYRYFAV